MSGSQVIALVLPPVLRVIGEDIEGEVQLNFLELKNTPVEEVHVKLRGSVFTRITRQTGQSSVTKRQRVELLRQTVSLWSRGSAYPPPDTHILALPFRFTLSPSQPLPSCTYNGDRRHSTVGTVAYSIEVVGVRSGLHFNKRIAHGVPLLPSNEKGAALSRELRAGFTGAWQSIEFAKQIRKGIWGEFSNVKVTLTLPAIEVFPIFTPIPFVLNITTVSKPMKQEETPLDQPIFPAPPLTAKGVEFKLMRAVVIRTGSWKEKGRDSVGLLGGLGAELFPPSTDGIQCEPMERTWLPDVQDEKKKKGSWKQEVNFRSTFQLTCPPTFESHTMTVKYVLNLKVEFPGIGNDLKAEHAIVIASSMMPPGTGTWDGPPQELDLPPAYFSATNWDHDEKDTN